VRRELRRRKTRGVDSDGADKGAERDSETGRELSVGADLLFCD
jgi:hypothetical protein